MLYLLAMYPILQLEINLIKLGYTGLEAILEDKKYGIKNNYNKLINLACRYVAKIDEVYRNKPN